MKYAKHFLLYSVLLQRILTFSNAQNSVSCISLISAHFCNEDFCCRVCEQVEATTSVSLNQATYLSAFFFFSFYVTCTVTAILDSFYSLECPCAPLNIIQVNSILPAHQFVSPQPASCHYGVLEEDPLQVLLCYCRVAGGKCVLLSNYGGNGYLGRTDCWCRFSSQTYMLKLGI